MTSFPAPRFERLPIRLDDGTEATVSELDAAGMCVETTAPLHVGDALTLELRPPGSAVVFVATGTVAAVQPAGHGTMARLHFTELRLRDIS